MNDSGRLSRILLTAAKEDTSLPTSGQQAESYLNLLSKLARVLPEKQREIENLKERGSTRLVHDPEEYWTNDPDAFVRNCHWRAVEALRCASAGWANLDPKGFLDACEGTATPDALVYASELWAELDPEGFLDACLKITPSIALRASAWKTLDPEGYRAARRSGGKEALFDEDFTREWMKEDPEGLLLAIMGLSKHLPFKFTHLGPQLRVDILNLDTQTLLAHFVDNPEQGVLEFGTEWQKLDPDGFYEACRNNPLKALVKYYDLDEKGRENLKEAVNSLPPEEGYTKSAAENRAIKTLQKAMTGTPLSAEEAREAQEAFMNFAKHLDKPALAGIDFQEIFPDKHRYPLSEQQKHINSIKANMTWGNENWDALQLLETHPDLYPEMAALVLEATPLREHAWDEHFDALVDMEPSAVWLLWENLTEMLEEGKWVNLEGIIKAMEGFERNLPTLLENLKETNRALTAETIDLLDMLLNDEDALDLTRHIINTPGQHNLNITWATVRAGNVTSPSVRIAKPHKRTKEPPALS